MRGIMPIRAFPSRACLLALTFSACTAQLSKADVRDGAGCFKAETVAKANKMIEQMQKKFKKDLIIETIASVPKDKEAEATSKDEAVKSRFFSEWAAQKSGPIGEKEIYVLITKAPLHFQVQVGEETLKKQFTTIDIRNLRSLLADEFNKRNFDDSLIECVEYVQQSLDRAAHPLLIGLGAAAPSPGGGKVADPAPTAAKAPANTETEKDSALIRMVGIGLVVVLGLGLVVARFRKRQA